MPAQVAGMTYTMHPGAATGARVTAADVVIGGAPLVPAQTYRTTINSIIAENPGFANAMAIVGDGIDLDLLVDYLGAHAPLSPPALVRITAN
ncbi:MAG: 5'-nucleotidase C-terminal domain-containing protein [Proteobacteria bacterium]|nr:5'-nucleotidase C-terminal domain-containing protein [Pseudomonadota bacterium]